MPQQPFDAEFMRRMAELTHGTLSGEDDGPAAAGEPRVELPEALAGQVAVYEIRGPLFFGAAQRAMGRIGRVSGRVRVLIMRLERVPTMDATGLVALESVLDRLYRSNIKVIFAGLTEEVNEILDRAGIKRVPGRLAYAPDTETAISMAIVHAARIGKPTLVIVAGKDEVVPDLATKLPSDVKPVVIDGASHFFLDLYGEEAADTIAKFVQSDQAMAK